MPNFDKTGPKGDGPQTGKGMGNCKPNDQKSNGRGLRRGQGRGRNR